MLVRVLAEAEGQTRDGTNASAIEIESATVTEGRRHQDRRRAEETRDGEHDRLRLARHQGLPLLLLVLAAVIVALTHRGVRR